MDLIQNIEGLQRLPPAPAGSGRDTAQPTPLVAAYRQFLTEPMVENEFHTVKALAHRAVSTGCERHRLTDQAATAEVEAGRLSRADDEDLRPRFGFFAGTTMALLLAAVDSVPAFLAAQAFGLDQPTTIGITVVLVAGLGCGMWAITHHHSGRQRWLVVAALGAGLVAIGALRWWYVFVTAGDEVSAVLEAVGLTIFTTLLVWLGVVVLGLTKARRVSQAERRASALRRRAERAAAAETALQRRFEMAMREYVGRAQVFSSRNLDDEESRARFLDLVRSEVER